MNWFVIFHPKEKKHWWARRFSHVSLAGFSNETWTQLDLGRSGVDVRTFYAHDDVQDYLSYLTAHHVVIFYGEGSHGNGGEFWRPLTCVGFVKHTLGMRARALSPDRLFETLIRVNKPVINNETQNARRNG